MWGMKTVFLFLKNPLFISDLLKTDYITYLSSKYRVVVFSSTIDESTGDYFSSLNVDYVHWQTQAPKLFIAFKFLRTACMHEFDSMTSLQSYYASPAFMNDKRARLLRFLSRPLAPWLTVDTFTALEYFFMKRSRLFEDYCRRYRPSAVVTATPGIQVFDAEAILLAKKAGLPTVATNLSWDNLTSFKCVRSRKPDYLFVWNEVLKDAAVRFHGFKPERVLITGSMRFDRYFDNAHFIPGREEFLRSKRLNPKYKTILFATAGRAPFQTDVLRGIIRERNAGAIPHVNILIRLHPFDSYEYYREFVTEKDVWVELAGKEKTTLRGTKTVELDRNAFINLKATLTHTDVNVNYKSTISLESFIFDKPVINFLAPGALFQNTHYYDQGSYYYPLIKTGAVALAENHEALIREINAYLKNPERHSESRKRMSKAFFYREDGLAYKRNVDFLEELIENPAHS